MIRLNHLRCLVATAAIAGAFLSVPSAAEAQSFDGITVIELKDPVGMKALGTGRGDYIITFVSALGTYAATLSGRGDRGCVAWARPGSYTGGSIAFGLAADEYEPKVVHPPVCLPFSLTFEDASTVRVRAENHVPSSLRPGAEAPLVRYSRRRPVVTQVPLAAIDWGKASFSRHHVRNVPLGPIVPGRGIEYKVGPLHRSSSGSFKGVQATAGGNTGGPSPDTVLGRVAGKEVTGWPWDVIFALWSARYLDQPSTRSAFEGTIVETFGRPGFIHEKSGRWYWLYDLRGNLLGERDAAPGNCLLTMEFWNGASLVSLNRDLGPWGCQLIMTLNHGASASTVNSYRIEVVSGYVMAINHFLNRLHELAEVREKIRRIEGAEPKL